MATTRLTDIVPVKVFSSVVEGKLIQDSKFRAAGIVGTDSRVTAKAQTAGLEVTLREWKRVNGGEAANQSDNPADKFSPAAVAMNSFLARVISRTLGFSAMDIQDYASDADAVEYATSEIARLKLMDEQSTMLATLTGVLADNAANDAGDMIKNVSITTGAITVAQKMSKELLISGRAVMGDRGEDLKSIIIHSDIANALRILEPNAFVPHSKTDIGLSTYYGWNVVETDAVGKTGAGAYPIYTSYMCGDNLFAYAAVPVENALVQVRDEFAGGGSGEETVISRVRYLLPMVGFDNIAAPANGVSQTGAELSAAVTWDRKIAQKAIPLVAIRTNG